MLSSTFLLSLPPVMYYERCLITQPGILHTGWHIYLFALYLFAFTLLYAKKKKSFCDRVVYSLALPRPRSNNEQIERGRRAIDGQSSGLLHAERRDEVVKHASGGTCLLRFSWNSIRSTYASTVRRLYKYVFLPLACHLRCDARVCWSEMQRSTSFNAAVLMYI